MTSIRSGLESLGANSDTRFISAVDRGEPPESDREKLIEDFRRYAAQEAATSERVAGVSDIPQAVVRYLQAQDLPLQVVAAGEIIAGGVNWNLAAELDISDHSLRSDGDTLVTGCYAGLAEAGAIVTVSSAGYPNECHFLAGTHIVVVAARRIFADDRLLWPDIKNEFGANLPRSMSWIVGPSRTADLGVPSKLGAHGPARVHLLIVDD